jgi:hypothetical protein
MATLPRTLRYPRCTSTSCRFAFAIAYAFGFGLYLFSPSHEFKREGARIPW